MFVMLRSDIGVVLVLRALCFQKVEILFGFLAERNVSELCKIRLKRFLLSVPATASVRSWQLPSSPPPQDITYHGLTIKNTDRSKDLVDGLDCSDRTWSPATRPSYLPTTKGPTPDRKTAA